MHGWLLKEYDSLIFCKCVVNKQFILSLTLFASDDGIDTRIHGIKIKSSKEQDAGLSRDHFSPENLVRYPKLENCDPKTLYHRSVLVQR